MDNLPQLSKEVHNHHNQITIKTKRMSSMWKQQLTAVKLQPRQPIRNFFKFTLAISKATFMFLYFFTVSVAVFTVFMIALELGFSTLKSIGK